MSAFDAPVCLGEASSVCLLSSWCYRGYTLTQMEGQVLQGLVCTDHLGSRNVCLHNCHCFWITNIATCYVCTVLLSSLRWKFWGGMIIWNYVVGRLNDIHSIWIALYVYRYLIQKNKFIEFSRHVYLWIQRFLMKQIPNKNESHAFEFTKKVV